MAGRPSPQNPLISQLTLPPETITSCYPGIRHTEFQPHSGRHHENGRGTKIDFEKANEWYRKASVQGDALAIGNLGMLYVRGQGVKENKIAGVALLLVSAALDPSPENHAKQNLSGIRGLTSEMAVAARALSGEFSSAKNLLVPLDQYLTESDNNRGK